MSASDAVNRYLITDYLYHWVCLRCGAVQHRRAGGETSQCECGEDCWRGGYASPAVPEPWYVQSLDASCPTCRKTLATLRRLDAPQLALLEVGA